MKKTTLFLFVLLFITNIFALNQPKGDPRNVLFHIVAPDGSPITDPELITWQAELLAFPGDIKFYDEEGNQVLIVNLEGTNCCAALLNVANFANDWLEGHQIKLTATYLSTGQIGSGIMTLTEGNGIQYYGFSALGLDANEPIILNQTGSGIEEVIPEYTTLYQNYPNPFNPSTAIKFYNKVAGNVNITVYNYSGQVVANLINTEMLSGMHTINFDGTRLATGIYYYALNTPDTKIMKKMVLVK